jgi:hypothetical protein
MGPCEATDKRFSVTSEMEEMKGKIFCVSSHYGDALSINGFTWDAEDIIPLTNEKKETPAPKHFDINELM